MEKLEKFSHFSNDRKVTEWLRDIFQEEDIPSFDESPEFVEALKEIMSANEAAERDAKAIIKAEKNMKDFYDGKVKDLQLVTSFIQLNSETCGRVESLASLAEKMNLKEPNLTNFLLAMTEIEDKELVEIEKKCVIGHDMAVFSKKTKETMKVNEKLRRYQKSLATVVEKQKDHYSDITQELEYFKRKKINVNHSIYQSKKSLEEAGYFEDTEIKHSFLIQKAKDLKDLQEQLKTLQDKLEVYQSLPASLDTTVIKINEQEKVLLDLEDELQNLLQLFEKS